MNNIRKENNIYFNNISKFNTKFGSSLNTLKSDLYKFWMRDLTVNKHQNIQKKLIIL